MVVHLIYPLDLPNNEETKNLLKAALKALAVEHQELLGRLNLEIDQVVFQPGTADKAVWNDGPKRGKYPRQAPPVGKNHFIA